MDMLIFLNRYLHILAGFCGLAAWWVPVLTSKGGPTHKRLGKVFLLSAYVIGVTAVLSSPFRIVHERLEGGAWGAIVREAGFLIFLSYLGILTLGLAHFGVRVLRTRRNPGRLSTPLVRALIYAMMAASVVVVVHALLFWSPTSIIMLILSPLGFMQGLQQRRYIAHPPAQRKPWFYAHMDAMLGAGIAFHTAFLVFGSRIVFDLSILGQYNWVPWVLPGVIGTIGGGAWRRAYMRKFGDLPRPAEVAHVQ